MGEYRNAQICLNGHIVSERIDTSPNLSEKHCHRCGAETIEHCLKCGASIRGEYYTPGLAILSVDVSAAPAYCYACGEPYPWTESTLEATRMLLDEDDDLKSTDKERIKGSLVDLMSDTPKTSLAVTRVKKAFLCIGDVTKEAMMKFIVSFACEAAKSQFGIK